MELNENGLKDRAAWERAGYQIPGYDRAEMIRRTREEPEWVHFGAGNIFRAFPAHVAEGLLNRGLLTKGIVAVEGFDWGLIAQTYRPFDDYCILVTLKTDGELEKCVIGSVAESLCIVQGCEVGTEASDAGAQVCAEAEAYAGAEAYADWERLKEIFRNPSLKMVSFTITEKGYGILDGQGESLPAVEADLAAGPQGKGAGGQGAAEFPLGGQGVAEFPLGGQGAAEFPLGGQGAAEFPLGGQGVAEQLPLGSQAAYLPLSYLGKVAALLYERFLAGRLPLALVSMDNCSENGRRLEEALLAYAEGWEERGLAEPGFVEYVKNPELVSFPWTMIDKITPRPDEEVLDRLLGDGIRGISPVVTAGGTYAAPFVNAEECEYLVIEDRFPAGRLPLEEGGVYFTGRETVKRVERMKVSTCLNPLHTALAVFGCLLGYSRIHAEMRDADLVGLIRRLGYTEGLPVAADPGILKPEEFLDEVVEIRLPNRFLPDSPQRIATDTSQKLAVRFGETVKARQAAGLPVEELRAVPLVYAGWLRYLLGMDDSGRSFEVSADPLLKELEECLRERKKELAEWFKKERGEEKGSRVDAMQDSGEAGNAMQDSGGACGGAEDAMQDSGGACGEAGNAMQDSGGACGGAGNAGWDKIRELLSREDIFGVDLWKAGLAEQVIVDFRRMLAGAGSVRTLLKERLVC